MCKFCVQHGKGNKWFHHVDNFEKKHLDDPQRLELSRAIYLDLAKENIPASGFMTQYQVLFKGIPFLLKTPLVKHAIRPAVNRLVEQYHIGQVITLEEACRVLTFQGMWPCSIAGAVVIKETAKHAAWVWELLAIWQMTYPNLNISISLWKMQKRSWNSMKKKDVSIVSGL